MVDEEALRSSLVVCIGAHRAPSIITFDHSVSIGAMLIAGRELFRRDGIRREAMGTRIAGHPAALVPPSTGKIHLGKVDELS
jgi:hypothetical protein